MNKETLIISLISLPFCIGMVGAYTSAKKHMIVKHSTISSALMHGYTQGNLCCVVSLVIVLLVSCSLVGIQANNLVVTFLASFFFFVLISYLAGLVLYLPCAYLGCSMGARKKAEEEIARTQRQIIVEREAENTNPSTNDSDRKLNT